VVFRIVNESEYIKKRIFANLRRFFHAVIVQGTVLFTLRLCITSFGSQAPRLR